MYLLYIFVIVQEEQFK